VIEASGQVGPLGSRQVELDVVEGAGTRRGAEPVELAARISPPAQHAVREQTQATDVARRPAALQPRVDLERQRLVGPVQIVKARPDAGVRVLGCLVIPP
jgi:hypothetical protein